MPAIDFIKRTAAVFAAASVLVTTVSCSKRTDPVVIWTDNPEIVSYVELFNLSHDNEKAVVIYKEDPAHSLPPAKDEVQPDILIAPFLKNSGTRKYFTPLDYLIQEKSISRASFYSKIIDYGVINEKQYLIPLSFNLPAIVFNKKDEELIKTNHLLNIDQIRDLAGSFNKTYKSGAYSSMGYAPSWDTEFLYLVTKLNGTGYMEKGNSFTWNDEALQNSIQKIKDWTSEKNTNTTSEQNFQFRYLYMPKYRQVTTDRCLFVYIPSDELFTLTDTQSAGLAFRWIEQDGTIPVEDDIVSIGLYKHSKNTSKAEEFIAWLINEGTQKQLIERTENMKLDTVNFGIAGGFSSLKAVNEKYYPNFYRQLLGNLPSEEYLSMPKILPHSWNSLKANVIIPYLTETTNTDSQKEPATLQERISDWTKQFF